MTVEAVDERDSGWEDPAPRYRIYLFAGDEPGHERDADGEARRGLVWLVGMDANDQPHSELEHARRSAMLGRRGRPVVLAE